MEAFNVVAGVVAVCAFAAAGVVEVAGGEEEGTPGDGEQNF